MTHKRLGVCPPWGEIVGRIRASEPGAVADLYYLLLGFRDRLRSKVGVAADDLYHDLIVDLIPQIQRGAIRDPRRLAGFVTCVINRNVADHWDRTRKIRDREQSAERTHGLRSGSTDPETMAIQQEHRQIAARVLSEMPQRDREVLVRFYVNEETPAQIQREMVLSSNQFRLLKSRAKARFSKAVQASLPAQSPAV